MSNIQSTIENLLLSTGRTGISNVISELRKNDFYDRPATQVGQRKTTLGEHSLSVYRTALELNRRYSNYDIDQDSLIIACLLHDVCKVTTKPYGRHKHGFKSLELLEDWGLMLTDDEVTAICFHMGACEIDTNSPEDWKDMSYADKVELCKLLQSADKVSAFLLNT